jgi:hypothetical protein
MKGYLPLIVLATLAMTGCAASTVAPVPLPSPS